MTPLLYYSTFPLGFHNVEAERKALAFADAGYDVLYALAPLIRNPRPTEVRRVLSVLASRAGHRAAPAGSAAAHKLRATTLAVVPPRQLARVRRLNGLLVDRQVRRALGDVGGLVAWLRWPTPEVVESLRHLRPDVVVYEVVDSYWETPGVVGRWRDVYERAERELLARADTVVAPGEAIASRFRPLHPDVRLLRHGVDPFGELPPRAAGSPTTLGFVGTLDYRIDVPVVRALAGSHPEWTVRLAGPVAEGFDPRLLADLPNVSLEPPVPHERLGERLAEFDLGLMPYFDHPHYTHMSPVKNLELLAAGKPAVARPSPALAPFAEQLYLAATPAEFVAQAERALAEDSPERAAARREVAAEHTWDRRLAEMLALVGELRRRAA